MKLNAYVHVYSIMTRNGTNGFRITLKRWLASSGTVILTGAASHDLHVIADRQTGRWANRSREKCRMIAVTICLQFAERVKVCRHAVL